MTKKVIVFGNIEIEKLKLHDRKNLIFFKDVDIDNILIPNMVSFGQKNINALFS